MPPPTPYPTLQIEYSPIKSAQEHQSTNFKQNMNRAAELQKRQRQLRAATDKKSRGLLVSGKEPVLMIRKNAEANARAKYGGCLVM